MRNRALNLPRPKITRKIITPKMLFWVQFQTIKKIAIFDPKYDPKDK